MRVTSVPTLEAARASWETLEEPAANVFSSWEWASTWWAAFGAGRKLDLRIVHDGDRLVAVLPLYRADRGPVPILRLIGHGVGDELGPICRPEDADTAAAALCSVAKDALPAHGLMLLDRLRGDTKVLDGLPTNVVRTESTPTIAREGRTWEEWLASRSSNFRQEIRRREKRLVRDNALSYRLTTDETTFDDDFTILLKLHQARWEGADSTAFLPNRAAFHRDFARRALARGWLRLWLAEFDGTPVAAWYGLRFAKDEWYYQAGRDPAWDRSGVGTALLVHSIRSAFTDGVNTYRLGIGDEGYKARFSSGDPGVTTLAVGRGITSRTAQASAKLLARLPAFVRRPLARAIR